LAGLALLNPLGFVGVVDGNWMCATVNVEYKGTAYPCPVFDWITKHETSFAIGKGIF